MNPRLEEVTMKNVTNEDIETSWKGSSHVVKAGASVKVPSYVASFVCSQVAGLEYGSVLTDEKVEEKVEAAPEPSETDELVKEYEDLSGKNVSGRFKNDEEWLTKKIAELKA